MHGAVHSLFLFFWLGTIITDAFGHQVSAAASSKEQVVDIYPGQHGSETGEVIISGVVGDSNRRALQAGGVRRNIICSFRIYASFTNTLTREPGSIVVLTFEGESGPVGYFTIYVSDPGSTDFYDNGDSSIWLANADMYETALVIMEWYMYCDSYRDMSSSRPLIAFLQNPIVAVAQATSILHCINEYAFGITTCAGPSMMPTFNLSGDVIFVEKFSSRNGTLGRGDVVIAVTPQNAKLKVCKRIIGLPGETVIVPSKSWFNSERPEFVPPGHVWLEGDNAANSTDSRAYGPIPLAMVRGRVFYKAWPPTEIGPVRRLIPEQASPVLGTRAREFADAGIRVPLRAADSGMHSRQDSPHDGSTSTGTRR